MTGSVTDSLRLAVISVGAVCALGVAGTGGAESSSNHRAMLGPRLIDAMQSTQSPSEKIAINVSLKRDDLAAPGPLRRAAVHARQNRVLGSLRRGTLDLAYRFESLSGFSGRISPSAIEGLRRHPEVVAIHLDYELHASLAEGNALIGADSVHAGGLTGSGVVVAVLDTGIDTNHPDLADDIVAEQCFCNDHPSPNQGCCPSGGPVQSGAGAAEDDEGHGTHTAGVITSGGVVSAVGVAPDAGIVAIKVLAANGRGTSSNTAAGFDWIVSNHAAFGIDIVNASLGDGLEHNNPLVSPCSGTLAANAVSLLHAAGIAVFAASGNEAYDNGISEPACIADAISVGGVYDAALGTVGWCGNSSCTTTLCADVTGPDVFVCHSNSDEILDVLAPNWRTTSPSMGGGASAFGGTSASSPYAAGQAALLLEADSTLLPNDIRMLLKSHGPSVTNSDNGLSFPRSDVSGAIALLATCGDGVLEFGESCDDGNVVDGDCCSAICEYDPVGSGCDDNDPCTAESCDILDGCVHTPIPGCPAPIPSGSTGSRGILLAVILGSVALLSSAGARLSRRRLCR